MVLEKINWKNMLSPNGMLPQCKGFYLQQLALLTKSVQKDWFQQPTQIIRKISSFPAPPPPPRAWKLQKMSDTL